MRDLPGLGSVPDARLRTSDRPTDVTPTCQYGLDSVTRQGTDFKVYSSYQRKNLPRMNP